MALKMTYEHLENDDHTLKKILGIGSDSNKTVESKTDNKFPNRKSKHTEPAKLNSGTSS